MTSMPVIKIDTASVEDRAEIGILCIRQGLLEQGQLILKSCCDSYFRKEQNPPLEWYYFLGLSYLGLHNYFRAQMCFAFCCRFKVSQPFATYYLAIAKVLQNKHNEAIVHLYRLTEAYPNFAPIWHLLGQIYLENQELTKAISCFKQVISLKPNFRPAYDILCNLLYYVGSMKELRKYKKMSYAIPSPA